MSGTKRELEPRRWVVVEQYQDDFWIVDDGVLYSECEQAANRSKELAEIDGGAYTVHPIGHAPPPPEAPTGGPDYWREWSRLRQGLEDIASSTTPPADADTLRRLAGKILAGQPTEAPTEPRRYTREEIAEQIEARVAGMWGTGAEGFRAVARWLTHEEKDDG